MTTTVLTPGDMTKLQAVDADLAAKVSKIAAELAAKSATDNAQNAEDARNRDKDQAQDDEIAALKAEITRLKDGGPGPQPGPDPKPDAPAEQGVIDLGNYRRGREGDAPAVIFTPAQLASDKLFPPMSREWVLGRGGDPIPTDLHYELGDYQYLNADAVPDLAIYQGQTGERDEIGPDTEEQAEWLLGGSADAMLEMAEASGSMPIHALLDGKIVDTFANPEASFDPRGVGSDYFNIEQVPDIPDRGERVIPDTAHHPPLCYIPYLATRDPYFLEEVQFSANWHILAGPSAYDFGKGVLFPWQQRQVGWGFRDLKNAYLATLLAEKNGALPAICQPSSYFKKILDNNLAWHTRFMNGEDPDFPLSPDVAPLVKSLGIVAMNGDGTWISCWQQDYINAIIGLMVWSGKLPEWRGIYEKQLNFLLTRFTGPYRSQGIQYYTPAGAGATWEETLKKNGYLPTDDGNFNREFVGGVPHYVGYARFCLRLAVMNGVTDPRLPEALAYVEQQMKILGYGVRRWALA